MIQDTNAAAHLESLLAASREDIAEVVDVEFYVPAGRDYSDVGREAVKVARLDWLQRPQREKCWNRFDAEQTAWDVAVEVAFRTVSR